MASPSHLVRLYKLGLLHLDDEVRPADSPTWRKAGDLGSIRGLALDARIDARRLAWVAAATSALALCAAIWLQRHAPPHVLAPRPRPAVHFRATPMNPPR